MAGKAEKRDVMFLQVVSSEGKLGLRFDDPTPDTKAITNSKGKTNLFELFDYAGPGKIEHVYIYDKEPTPGLKFEELVITLVNKEGKREMIQVPFNSNYASSFIQRLEGVDPTKEVEIHIFKIKDKEKTAAKGKDVFSQLLLQPDGQRIFIQSNYKKDSGNTLPEFKKNVKIITKDKKKQEVVTWDTGDFLEALRQIVFKYNDDLKAMRAPVEKGQELTANDLPDSEHDIHGDDGGPNPLD
jgi:hypothetical protein